MYYCYLNHDTYNTIYLAAQEVEIEFNFIHADGMCMFGGEDFCAYDRKVIVCKCRRREAAAQ